MDVRGNDDGAGFVWRGGAGRGPRSRRNPDVGSGRIAWFDITTTDMPRKAKEFYGKLFGWTFLPLKGTDLAAEIVADRTSIGTLPRRRGQDQSPTTVWSTSRSPDMRESCKKAQALGGMIPPGFPSTSASAAALSPWSSILRPSRRHVLTYVAAPPPAATK